MCVIAHLITHHKSSTLIQPNGGQTFWRPGAAHDQHDVAFADQVHDKDQSRHGGHSNETAITTNAGACNNDAAAAAIVGRRRLYDQSDDAQNTDAGSHWEAMPPSRLWSSTDGNDNNRNTRRWFQVLAAAKVALLRAMPISEC